MQKMEYIARLSGLRESGIRRVLQLFEEGATIPFIARYRKEMSEGMDEVQLAMVRDLDRKYQEITAKQQAIINAMGEAGVLTDEREAYLRSCFDSDELDDLYLPFKQRRQTRGDKARKQGLEPLAKIIMAQKGGDLTILAERFVKGDVEDEEMAIAGAKDIVADWINENTQIRAALRTSFERHARLESKVVKGKELAADTYRDYFDHSERLEHCSSHRFLALYRANREGLLQIKARPDEERAIEQITRRVIKPGSCYDDVLTDTCKDAYKRLIRPSLENEILAKAKEKADKEAISVFAKNLRQLLLAPPLGSKRILAIDPGFRTGCKVVCLDAKGDLLDNATIYPHPPQKESAAAKSKIAQLVEVHKIEAIAVGDGTAGRETENLIKSITFRSPVEVYVVREDGASIYSASPIARKEFPNYDVTVRGSVSIGRRLMDPLAELVKIDPKSIGVGQYQHEVNQNQLKESLDDVVISCVNKVGVDLNTASAYLLAYVSGLGEVLANNIVTYRSEQGAFSSRAQLKEVPRLGPKAFQQAAGFIRVRESENPLDNSAVHPESYHHVAQFAKKLNTTVASLIGNDHLLDQLKKVDFPEIDEFTFDDIVNELKKPGRDPRKQIKILEFDSRIRSIGDLKPGMILPGIVSNVTNFGAFVNIGIKENGLIHKSHLSDSYVEDPSQYISLHEHVSVQVLEIDPERKRIGLKLMR